MICLFLLFSITKSSLHSLLLSHLIPLTPNTQHPTPNIKSRDQNEKNSQLKIQASPQNQKKKTLQEMTKNYDPKDVKKRNASNPAPSQRPPRNSRLRPRKTAARTPRTSWTRSDGRRGRLRRRKGWMRVTSLVSRQGPRRPRKRPVSRVVGRKDR